MPVEIYLVFIKETVAWTNRVDAFRSLGLHSLNARLEDIQNLLIRKP